MNKYIRFEEQPLLESGVFARELVFDAINDLDRMPSLGQALAASWGRQSRGDPAELKGLWHRLSAVILSTRLRIVSRNRTT